MDCESTHISPPPTPPPRSHDCDTQVSLELLRSVLSKESALNDLDCVDKLLGMIAPILTDPPSGPAGEVDTAMQVRCAIAYHPGRKM